jgi:hypothetical protein
MKNTCDTECENFYKNYKGILKFTQKDIRLCVVCGKILEKKDEKQRD